MSAFHFSSAKQEPKKAANPTVKQLEKVANAVGKKLVLEMV
jgi:hypothetical protein